MSQATQPLATEWFIKKMCISTLEIIKETFAKLHPEFSCESRIDEEIPSDNNQPTIIIAASGLAEEIEKHSPDKASNVEALQEELKEIAQSNMTIKEIPKVN